VDRRAFVTTLAGGLLAAPLAAQAQSEAARMGLLGPNEEPRFSEIAVGLKQGLREQGHPEDLMQVFEGRVLREDSAGARTAVQGFIGQRVAVLFVIGSVLARLARETAPEIPIVFITPGDPVAAGLVKSLARPGGNMTGMTFEYPELSGKRLELLHEIVPSVGRVLALYDPRDASPLQGVVAARKAATALGIVLVERKVQTAEEITGSLKALDQVGALLGVPGGITSSQYEAIIQAANERRLPTIFHARTRSTRDALVTYGASDIDIARQSARLVGKILKGANAGDLPVERPTTLRFVINLKTARALGLTISPSVLARVDEVIQ
jgi:putative tryptophan/tyrosine transport system substrate-binding protein